MGSKTVAPLLEMLLVTLPALDEIADEMRSGDRNAIAIFIQSYGALQQLRYDNSSVEFRRERLMYRIHVAALKDRLFELINTGHWSTVPRAVRAAYTLTTFLGTLFTVAEAVVNRPDTPIDRQTVQQLINKLDDGLLLGCPLTPPHQRLLSTAIERITDFTAAQGNTDGVLPCPALFGAFQHARRTFNEPCDVPVLRRPALEQFEREHFGTGPAILTDCMDTWPAMERWLDGNYLLRCAGDRTVPIEVGTHYAREDWSQQMLRFGDFMSRNLLPDGVRQPNRNMEYLAQHNLFDQIPALRSDLCVPEYCCLSEREMDEPTVDIKAWIGPAQTVSPAHTDPKHNLFCQVFGYKQILLASPADTPFMYAHGSQLLQNTSQVDAECLDYNQFPLVANVRWLRLRLYRGEMLYIPPGWWHHVRSLERSFSVSFWWE